MATDKITQGVGQSGVVGDVSKLTDQGEKMTAELSQGKAVIKPATPEELEVLKAAKEAAAKKVPEIVDSIELQLPNGARVEMEQPKVATAFTLSRLCSTDQGQIAIAYIKSMLYISRVNGEKVMPLSNMVDVQLLANKLGDDGLDVVLTAYTIYWPGVTPENLPVIKKNLRGQRV